MSDTITAARINEGIDNENNGSTWEQVSMRRITTYGGLLPNGSIEMQEVTESEINVHKYVPARMWTNRLAAIDALNAQRQHAITYITEHCEDVLAEDGSDAEFTFTFDEINALLAELGGDPLTAEREYSFTATIEIEISGTVRVDGDEDEAIRIVEEFAENLEITSNYCDPDEITDWDGGSTDVSNVNVEEA